MSIKGTLAYFDQFEYPLTPFECWRYTIGERALPFAQFSEELERVLATCAIERHGAFLTLPGREAIIATRNERSRLAEEKYKKALRFLRVVRWFPFVRLVGVCNTLALSHSREDADIDFFVIAARGHVWTVRFWTTVYALLLGERPNQHHLRDSFCLSFFVAEDAMNLRPIALDTNDVYLAEWVHQMVPVFDAGNVYARFWDANRWIKELLPNAFAREVASRRRIKDSHAAFAVRSVLEFLHWVIGPAIERMLRRFQWKRFPESIRSQANRGTHVILSPSMLKFHENDRRETYRREWLAKTHGI